MADYEQLTLFDLTPYISQQPTVEAKALNIKKVEPLEQSKGKQLELNLFIQHSDEIQKESIRLAA